MLDFGDYVRTKNTGSALIEGCIGKIVGVANHVSPDLVFYIIMLPRPMVDPLLCMAVQAVVLPTPCLERCREMTDEQW